MHGRVEHQPLPSRFGVESLRRLWISVFTKQHQQPVPAIFDTTYLRLSEVVKFVEGQVGDRDVYLLLTGSTDLEEYERGFLDGLSERGEECEE